MNKFAEILSTLSVLKCNYKFDKDAGLIIVYDIITNSEVLYIKYSLYAGGYSITWRYNSVDMDNSHKYCNDMLFQSEKDVIDFIISNCQYCIPKFEFNFNNSFFSRYTYTEIFVTPEFENRIEIRYGTYYTQYEGDWDLIVGYDVASELYDYQFSGGTRMSVYSYEELIECIERDYETLQTVFNKILWPVSILCDYKIFNLICESSSKFEFVLQDVKNDAEVCRVQTTMIDGAPCNVVKIYDTKRNPSVQRYTDVEYGETITGIDITLSTILAAIRQIHLYTQVSFDEIIKILIKHFK